MSIPSAQTRCKSRFLFLGKENIDAYVNFANLHFENLIIM